MQLFSYRVSRILLAPLPRLFTGTVAMESITLEKFRFVSGQKRKRSTNGVAVQAVDDEDTIVTNASKAGDSVSTVTQEGKRSPLIAKKSLEADERPRVTKMPVRDGILPYVARVTFKGLHGRWRERYTSICGDCFARDQVCVHNLEIPLRCLLVGHNPSEHAFQSGFFYSNPTNRMWLLLTGNFGKVPFKGLVPPDWDIVKQNNMPLALGVGLSDLGVEPGNDAATYSRDVLYQWRAEMYNAFVGHMTRAQSCCMRLKSGEIISDTVLRQQVLASIQDLIGDFDAETPITAFAPRIVAFTGKAQWKNLFAPPLKVCDAGIQPADLRPPGWPFPSTTAVFVLPSSSGRAAMTDAARKEPYMELAKLVHSIRWLPETVIGPLKDAC